MTRLSSLFNRTCRIPFAMADPRESSSYSVIPRIRYNTVGGVNGPLVILDNVRASRSVARVLACWRADSLARSNSLDTMRSSLSRFRMGLNVPVKSWKLEVSFHTVPVLEGAYD